MAILKSVIIDIGMTTMAMKSIDDNGDPLAMFLVDIVATKLQWVIL